jgi:hypothetical protein
MHTVLEWDGLAFQSFSSSLSLSEKNEVVSKRNTKYEELNELMPSLKRDQKTSSST